MGNCLVIPAARTPAGHVWKFPSTNNPVRFSTRDQNNRVRSAPGSTRDATRAPGNALTLIFRLPLTSKNTILAWRTAPKAIELSFRYSSTDVWTLPLPPTRKSNLLKGRPAVKSGRRMTGYHLSRRFLFDHSASGAEVGEANNSAAQTMIEFARPLGQGRARS